MCPILQFYALWTVCGLTFSVIQIKIRSLRWDDLVCCVVVVTSSDKNCKMQQK